VPRAALPYPLPEPGAPVRVAFVGQRTYFEACALQEPAGGLQPLFIDYRDAAPTAPVLEALEDFAPHVVVLFRPENLPAATFDAVRAPVVGFLTEPLPRAGRSSHPDLEYNLAELRRVDRNNVDRVICFDPLGWETASELLPTWRSMPLPVADGLYRRPTPSRRPPRVVFIGYSTMHRETALVDLKHKFDLPHYAHGLMGQELREVLAESDAGINLHGDRWLISFENRVLLHLAAGHLVISEPLDPKYGLDPGLHYLEVADQYDLDLRMHQLMQQPDAYDRVRIRGHRFSEQFRASRVWPRVIGDLFADLEAFGTQRVLAASV